jgi:D-alanyl-D-alanine carboxypeptidase (penicillin-binding protein 5/6)
MPLFVVAYEKHQVYHYKTITPRTFLMPMCLSFLFMDLKSAIQMFRIRKLLNQSGLQNHLVCSKIVGLFSKPRWIQRLTLRSILLFVFGLSLFLEGYLLAAPLSVSVQAEAAILMNASTGAILYEKNVNDPHHPASITKIATAVYALEIAQDKLLQPLPAPREALASISPEAKRRSGYTMPSFWLEQGGTHIGIKNGEELTLKDLLFGMLVSSGNDAANVIAMSLGGTIPQFMEDLNKHLQKIGCTQTHFCNPHGLYHPKHKTTAYDMALITVHAMKNPVFRKIVSTVRCTRPKTNKQEASVLIQTNRLLKTGKYYYSKAIGVKTGYIAMAQNTLVAAAIQDDRLLIAVLLKSKERDELFLDAIKLFEAAFNQPKVERILLKAGETDHLFFPDGAQGPIKTTIADGVTIRFYPAEEPELAATLQWKNLPFPIKKGESVGEIAIQTASGKTLQIVPLLANEDVKASWTHWFKSFF